MTYQKTFKLNHNEKPAKINVETGLVTTLNGKPNHNNPDFALLEATSQWDKNFSKAWSYLYDVLNARQLRMVMFMAIKARHYTNSLAPIGDDKSMAYLARYFDTNKNTIKADFAKLFKYGVYAKFELTEDKFEHKKYWVFNPYISYNGKGVSRRTLGLFDNTTIAKIVK